MKGEASSTKFGNSRRVEDNGLGTNSWVFGGKRGRCTWGLLGPLVLLLCLLGRGWCGQVIEVRGKYEVVTRNPASGKSQSERPLCVGFVVTLYGDAWQIAATNVDDKTDWAILVYEGTNTFRLVPYAKHIAVPRPESNLVYAAISSSPIYVPSVFDFLSLYMPWLTYGLSPRNVRTNKGGVIELPRPWTIARNDPLAFGFRWDIKPSADGRFVSECKVIRDTSLDLDENDEFLRPELEYPLSLAHMAEYRMALGVRKEIPNGFVNALYRCTMWYETNSMLIPFGSELKLYSSRFPLEPVKVVKLVAESIIVRTGEVREILPTVDGPTLVYDYRYRKATKKRIFNYAEYTLEPGEGWKSDSDPVLLAQVEYYLKHGPKRILGIRERRALARWVLVMVGVAPIIFVACRQLVKKLRYTKQPVGNRECHENY